MPEGGKLIIKTKPVDLDEDYIKAYGLFINPGTYVKIQITDTGTGMDKVTKQKVFEPFFTTKEEGKGTGMGLASVYGTVRTIMDLLQSLPSLDMEVHLMSIFPLLNRLPRSA